jgi:hypothetical protein
MRKSYFKSFLSRMVNIKDFKKALNLCNDQDEMQAYLNQILSPTNRISKEELSYAMAVSMISPDINSNVEACVFVLNNLILVNPLPRLERISSNLKAAKADMVADGNNVYKVFHDDFITLVEFFQNLAQSESKTLT